MNKVTYLKTCLFCMEKMHHIVMNISEGDFFNCFKIKALKIKIKQLEKKGKNNKLISTKQKCRSCF